MTTTLSHLVERVYKALCSGSVLQHPPTPTNPLGQSGVHTFVGDVINIVLSSDNEADAYKRLSLWLSGDIKIDEGN